MRPKSGSSAATSSWTSASRAGRGGSRCRGSGHRRLRRAPGRRRGEASRQSMGRVVLGRLDRRHSRDTAVPAARLRPCSRYRRARPARNPDLKCRGRRSDRSGIAAGHGRRQLHVMRRRSTSSNSGWACSSTGSAARGSNHPFWRTHFLLGRRRTGGRPVQRRQKCWIDTGRGRDVGTGPLPAPEPPVPLSRAAPPESPGSFGAGAGACPWPASPWTRNSGEPPALLRSSREAVVASSARRGWAWRSIRHLHAARRNIAASVARNSGALISLARLKTHDDYAYMHSVAVCALMIALARQLGRRRGARSCTCSAWPACCTTWARRACRSGAEQAGQTRRPEFRVIQSRGRGRGCWVRAGRRRRRCSTLPASPREIDGSGYPDAARGGDQPGPRAWARSASDAILQPPGVQAGLGSRQVDRADGRVAARPLRRDSLPGLRQEPRDLSDRLAGALTVRAARRRRQARVPGTDRASRRALLLDALAQMPISPGLIDLSRPCNDRIVGRPGRDRDWKFAHLDELWAGPTCCIRPAAGRRRRSGGGPLRPASA